MKTLKIATVILLVISWTIQNPAEAQAPIHKSVRFDTEAFALHQPKQYALQLVKKQGWTKADYQCLNEIWTHESHWNYRAKSSTSTAYGIGQLLIETSKSSATQIRNGIRYISYRYGNPCNAWKFWRSHYWY